MTVTPLRVADLAAAHGLSQAAGWNQTEADWRVFIDAADALCVRDSADAVIATGAALGYGEWAWLSMVLVDAHHRHRGIASEIVSACVERIHARGAVAVLDATAAGELVYGRLGFVAGIGIERWQRRGGAAAERARPPMPEALGRIVALDRRATGLDRGPLYASFLSRPATRAFAVDDGFVVARAGSRATQIGPLVARDAARALLLLDRAVATTEGEIFIDVPVRAAAVTNRLAALGFGRQRAFVRMALDPPPGAEVPGNDPTVFAIAGPEFG